MSHEGQDAKGTGAFAPTDIEARCFTKKRKEVKIPCSNKEIIMISWKL